jgi:hypothetical protein
MEAGATEEEASEKDKVTAPVAGDSSSQPSYVEALRSLERMRRTNRFYIGWAKFIILAFFAFGIAASLLLDRHGWSRIAIVLIDVTAGVAFIAAVTAFVHMNVNLWGLWRWPCPRCGERWPGWIDKAPLCSKCGLQLFPAAQA